MRRIPLAVCLTLITSCAKKLDGPTPSVNGVNPGAVCQRQLITPVAISGEGLSPLLTGALADSQLELPMVTLTRAQDLFGDAAIGEAIPIPDDPKDPQSSRIRWAGQQQMSFQVFPELGLEPGLYDVTVANSNGKSGSFPASLLAVPPPTLLAITPDIVCGDKETEVVLSGDYFIRSAAGNAQLVVGEKTFSPSAFEDCRPLPGSSGLEACKTARVTLPAGALAKAVHPVVVLNPSPVGCTSSEAATLTVVPKPTLAAVVPDLVCTAQGDNALVATGTGFLVIDGAAPKLVLSSASGSVALDGTASNCLPVEGPKETVQSCTTLSATLGTGALSAGEYQAVVTNPAPADCVSSEAVGMVVVPAPEVTSVVADIGCNAQGAISVAVNGTGFLTVGATSPMVRIGGVELASVASSCTPVTGSTTSASSCTTLTVQVPPSVPFGTQPLTVVNPAPAGCGSAVGPTLTLFDRPLISAIVPAGLCTDAQGLPVVITGSNFVSITSGNPAATVLPAVKVGTQSYTPVLADCTQVTGTVDTVQTCNQLTLTVDGSGFTPNLYDLVITNPQPVGCSSADTQNFPVTPPPVITAAVPGSICASGDTLQLTGANFLSGASVTLANLDGGAPTYNAATVQVSNDGGTALAEFAGGLTTGQFNLSLSNGNGCGASAPAPISVIPGPQLFFVDPSIVYNGVTVQATLFGTGFTLPVNGIFLSPSDGGAAIPLTVTAANQTNRAQVLMEAADGGVLPPDTYGLLLDDNTTCSASLENAVTVVDQTTLALANPPMQPPFGQQGASTPVSIYADVADGGGFQAVPRVYLNPVNPTPNTVAAPIGAVAYLSNSTLTALVPDTLPAGDYDLIVVNPDKQVGYAQSAFRVTQPSEPPPTISGLSPGSLPNTGAPSFKIQGANFRNSPALTVTLSCVDQAGVAVASPTLTITGTPTATEVSATVSNVGSAAACVVRVTNTDNATYADFSALVFTNPAKNLYAPQTGPTLQTPRRAPISLGGDATSAARFLYVLAGDDASGTALSSVETSPLTLVGVPQPFFTQRQGSLNQARTLAGGVRIGRWLYVAGGSSGTTRLDTVERSYILDPARRGEVTDLLLEMDLQNKGLDPGLYYYRVAAVMESADPFNKDGEELASDPFPVRVPDLTKFKLDVTVTWKPVPGAAKYLVYRSATPGAAVGTEQVIAEVSAPTVQFKDLGDPPISTQTPLPIGSLGKWETLAATLSVPREGAGVSFGVDPSDSTKAYLYVLGGRQSAGTALNSYEYLPLTLNGDGSQTPSALFVSGGTNTLSSSRWQLSATAATNALSPRIAAGSTFIYALSGLSATGGTAGAVATPDAAQVQAGGALSTFVQLSNLGRAGYATVVAADQVFAFGGNGGNADSSINNGEICGTGNTAGQCATKPNPPYVGNWNAGQTMGTSRVLMGGALHGAFIYIAAGNGTAGTPLNTTEYRIW